MRTNFTPDQLQSPRLAEADAILRKCVHCGLCTAACPTYVLQGDERDSPRGRIYLIKAMLEGGQGANAEVSRHVDRCLSCLSCVTACPSGVDYMHLADLARAHIEETAQRSPGQRLMRRMLGRVLPDPQIFRRALWAAMAGAPFKGLLRALGLKEVAEMLDLAGAGPPRRGHYHGATVVQPQTPNGRRVALLTGCVQSALRPEITDATVRVMLAHGIEVTVAEGQGCCGAVNLHLGQPAVSQTYAMRNVDAFSAVMRHKALDAIIVTASGCGTMMKDYAHLLSRDEAYRGRAKHVAGLTMDVSEYLASIETVAPKRWSDITVAYHNPCSMRNGQGIEAGPRGLLERVGFKVVDIAEPHMCCGSAGTYNILQSEIAGELRDRKVAAIAATGADVVASGNIGCIAQLQRASKVPVVHTIELVDWVLGGPLPRGMKALVHRGRGIDGGRR